MFYLLEPSENIITTSKFCLGSSESGISILMPDLGTLRTILNLGKRYIELALAPDMTLAFGHELEGASNLMFFNCMNYKWQKIHIHVEAARLDPGLEK